MVYSQVVYYNKYNRRGSSIKIDSVPMDEEGNIVVEDIEAYISIIAPNGDPVVDQEPMESYDNKKFFYIWDTERDSATGTYGVEIEVIGERGKLVYYRKDLVLN